MSKDFISLVDENICSKEQALEAYVSSPSVFFPPHPSYVVASTVKGFKKYWKGDLDLEGLRKKCYLRDVNGLYKYYGRFL